MERLNSHQWHIFTAACVVTAFAISVHLWTLLPLYLDRDTRSSVGTLIEATAKREGWLLSGLSIDHIGKEYVELIYRSHYRGTDLLSCYQLRLSNGALLSCDNS